jgi:DNA invertase Pin-like site-specific DNA recombinase
VVAKLDRLSRNTRFLLDIIESGADVVFCDLPQIPPGQTGKFLLTQMASVAELERGLISERTKAALAAAKARGVKLGNPNGAQALRGRQSGNQEAVKAVKVEAQRRADDLAGIIAGLAGRGHHQCACSRTRTQHPRDSHATRRSLVARDCGQVAGALSRAGVRLKRKPKR